MKASARSRSNQKQRAGTAWYHISTPVQNTVRKGKIVPTHLPRHRPRAPARGFRRLQALRERLGRDVPVVGVTRGRGLPDDELVRVDAVGDDLEQGGLRPGGGGGVEEGVAGGIFGGALWEER